MFCLGAVTLNARFSIESNYKSSRDDNHLFYTTEVDSIPINLAKETAMRGATVDGGASFLFNTFGAKHLIVRAQESQKEAAPMHCPLSMILSLGLYGLFGYLII